MKLAKVGITLVTAFSLFILSACGGGSQPAATSGSASAGDKQAAGKTYSFKITHITQTTHVWQAFAEKLGEELKNRSNGRMKLEIFPAGQLGPEKDMVQQLQSGSLDFGLITAPYMSTRSESFNGWMLPFMFENVAAAIKAKDSAPAKKMLQELDKQGMIGMDYMFTGNHNLLMRNNPVKSAADVKGKKIRITGGPVVQDFWTGVGASPTSMPLTEVYTSLQTGVIDGTSIDSTALITEKFYETAKYYVLSNQMAFPGVFVASKKVYEQLPPDDKKIVDEAAKAAITWGNNEAIAQDAKNVELLKSKLTVLEMPDKSTFNASKDEVYKKFSSNPIIKEFIDLNKK